MSRAIAGAAGAVVLALAALVPPARADVFGSISLVSQGALGAAPAQQAEYAHDTAISGDGRYVVFDGSIGGVAGVWRRDLQTGALQQVAGGDAELPSVSADGRFVSFTTNEGASLPAITSSLAGDRPAGEAGAVKEAVNVYVRDMALDPSRARAFRLASAADGPGERPLVYQPPEPSRPTAYGSTATGRSAISADGTRVAFVTTAISNLVSYPRVEKEEEEKGETPKPHTPALQVAVRDLASEETVLVSRCYVSARCEAAAAPAVAAEESGQSYGAVYPGGSARFAPPPEYGSYGESAPPGASISADGSTVAWLGEDVEQQAPLLPGESRSPHLTEPLWRRIGPSAPTPTERVTGGSDPFAPGCAESGELVLAPTPTAADPCQGPFVEEEEASHSGIVNQAGGVTGDFVPRLSADGYTVAFVSQAPLVWLGENFGRERTGQPSDLYVASMRPGLSRVQALTPLTELAGGLGAAIGATAPIFDFDVSPDGSQVAFATRRTVFPLGSPAYVSSQQGEAGLNELFDADLDDGTLTRVTHGFLGLDEASQHAHIPKSTGVDPYADPGDGALSPSFSDDDRLLAFASTASNLVYGDGNAPPSSPGVGAGGLDGSDGFVVERTAFAPLPTQQSISPAPEVSTAPAWALGVSALQRRDGTVLLYVYAPGAGRLTATARASVPASSAAGAARGAGARGRRVSRGRRRASTGRTVAPRTVASLSRSLGAGAGVATPVVLRLAKRYSRLAAQRGGFSASLSVLFAAPGRPRLRQTLLVSFERVSRTARRARRGPSRKRGGRR